MEPTTRSTGGAHILYDAAILRNPERELWPAGNGDEPGPAAAPEAAGRGAVRTRTLADGREVVVRHYRRGGWMARLCRDRYLPLPLARTRPWREWHLLARLFRLGLAVPRPVAARVVPAGPTYRGDLATERLPGARTLGEALTGAALPAPTWRRIGATLRRFHDAGADHADLNAHNILLDAEGGVYLVDFDGGRMRRPGRRWQRRNLRRLRRSLAKLGGRIADFRFTEADWSALLAGYAGEAA
ncbi:3-deoxy-D-manno-octulosonic acid kinase [Thiohalorhabdus sp.]|uniref:3-deoxy-D-manno-octulosonic acid kinase n=1 Tax=Thiohalorhabdus sp. TaxID=3094134 RepID=UPI002FC2B7FD